MLFSSPLVQGILVKRYKRFLADVRLADGQTITAHCPNSGAMRDVDTPGLTVWLSFQPNPARRHAFTWELVEVDDTCIGINTQMPNRLVAEALADNVLTELVGYSRIRREVTYGDSRFDFCLEADGKPSCFLEVKNVHWRRQQTAFFPDSVTVRGAKHVTTLATVAKESYRAVLLYIVQRQDVTAFCIAADIDPSYAAAADAAQQAGVETLCYACNVTPAGIFVRKSLPVIGTGA